MVTVPIEAYRDPYRRCERQCNHDLAHAVTLDELLSEDGPYPSVSPLLSPLPTRPARHRLEMPAAAS
jgi:hypothetical protein